MDKKDATRSLIIYQRFTQQADQVVEYLQVAQRIQHSLDILVPVMHHPPVSLAVALEEYLNHPDFEANRRAYKQGKLRNKETKAVNEPKKDIKNIMDTKKTLNIDTKRAGKDVIGEPAAYKPPAEIIDFFASLEEEQQTINTNLGIKPPEIRQPHDLGSLDPIFNTFTEHHNNHNSYNNNSYNNINNNSYNNINNNNYSNNGNNNSSQNNYNNHGNNYNSHNFNYNINHNNHNYDSNHNYNDNHSHNIHHSYSHKSFDGAMVHVTREVVPISPTNPFGSRTTAVSSDLTLFNHNNLNPFSQNTLNPFNTSALGRSRSLQASPTYIDNRDNLSAFDQAFNTHIHRQSMVGK